MSHSVAYECILTFEYRFLCYGTVYRISMPSGLISNVVAIWRNGTFDDQRMGLSTAVRRRNLQQTAIRTTVVYTDNYTLHHFEDYE